MVSNSSAGFIGGELTVVSSVCTGTTPVESEPREEGFHFMADMTEPTSAGSDSEATG